MCWPLTSYAVDSRWSLACCVSDFLYRLAKVAALHAEVTPVTYFTLGYILSGHLDEEITFSQCVSTTALHARFRQSRCLSRTLKK